MHSQLRLVSIIIPVYNGEVYLESCLQSVANQTYQNLEIILVDDGSTDGSHVICETWEKKDSRFRLFYQENAGAASARNHGIEKSRGTYISFVDCDDVISPECIETLMHAFDTENVDISIGGMSRFFDATDEVTDRKLDSSAKMFSGKEATKSMLYKKEITSSPCGRVFKRELFRNIKFEVGHIYEDLGIMPHLLLQAETVSYFPGVMYFYRMRSGSVSQRRIQMDRVWFSERIYEYMEREHSDLLPAAHARLFCSYFMTFAEVTRKHGDPYGQLWREIKKTRKNVLWDPEATKKLRATAAAAYLPADIFHLAAEIVLKGNKMS